MRHLPPDLLIDIAEGTRPESSASHLAECGECRRQLAELREMMAVAVSAEMPEPSPLFWDHLSARVRTAVAEDVERPAPWARVLNARVLAGSLGLIGAAAVLAMAVSMRTGNVPATTVTLTPPPVAAPADVATDDPSLTLLTDLADGLDWDAAVDDGLTVPVGAADVVVADLSDAERVELRRLLREAMSAPGA